MEMHLWPLIRRPVEYEGYLQNWYLTSTMLLLFSLSVLPMVFTEYITFNQHAHTKIRIMEP